MLPIVHFPTLPDDPAYEVFWSLRGKAIQAYASVEQSLCKVFAHLSGMALDAVGIVFFRITSAHSLHQMMDKLMKKKHGNTYSIFWRSVSKALKKLSDTRNHIVHWNVLQVDEGGKKELQLMLPDIFAALAVPVGADDERAPINAKGISEFINECYVYTFILANFYTIQSPEATARWTSEQLKSWSDIFQQELTYTIPSNSLLVQKLQERGIQLPSSPP